MTEIDQVQYREYTIVANPHRTVSGQWSTDVEIWETSYDGKKVTPYSAKNYFDTKEEAIKASLNFGKQILDGKINFR